MEFQLENLPNGFVPVTGTTRAIVYMVSSTADSDFYHRAYDQLWEGAPTVGFWERTETGFARPEFNIEAVNRSFFDWAKVDAEFRRRVASKFATYMPGFQISEDPIDLHRFFGCQEFRDHMNCFPHAEEGDTFHDAANGIVLAGWTVLRDYLIEFEPELAHFVASFLWLGGAKSRWDHQDPIDYLKHVSTSNGTNLVGAYALWMLQKDELSSRVDL